MPARDLTSRPDIYTAPATGPRSRPEPVPPAPQNPAARARVAEEPVAYAPPAGRVAPAPQVQVPQGTPEPASGADATQPPAGQLRRLPSARTAVSQGQHGVQSQPGQGQPGVQGQHGQGQHGVQSQPGQGQSGQGSPRSAPYSGPQPVLNQAAPAVYQAQNGAPAVYQAQNGAPGVYQAQNGAPGVSLSEAVQAAHEEGQEFGGSVARDAPALWLEAVLARKPRMPSDLEARLLQGSALPIDFLLHDEVRHALRRGFWDALERTRR